MITSGFHPFSEYHHTEAEVYQVGDNRISVEIPGVTDANEILAELGTPGTLRVKQPRVTLS